MRMALLHRRAAHEYEAGAGAQLLDVPSAAVAHPGLQAAYKLINEWCEWSLERHTTFNPFRHKLAAFVVSLPVAFARTGHHGAQRTHAPVCLEAAALVNDRLTRALGQAGK